MSFYRCEDHTYIGQHRKKFYSIFSDSTYLSCFVVNLKTKNSVLDSILQNFVSNKKFVSEH